MLKMLTFGIKVRFFFEFIPAEQNCPNCVECVSSSTGQPPRLSGAWAEPPQLNWSRVLQGRVLLLSLPRPPGAGLVVGWGGHGYQRCGEMICSPCSVPLGSPTVTHGTPATRSFHCCSATGGQGLIIRRETFFRRSCKRTWSTIAFIHNWQGFL